MSVPTPKQRVLDAIQRLPADTTLDEAIESLIFLAKIERGLRDADAGRVFSHEEVKRRFTS